MIEVGIMGILKDIIKAVAQPSINNAKGKIGESKVNKKLNPLLFGKVEHRQINNLIIMDNMGKTHQIDHIEIRENGIFCIETKNYIGLIYGSENQEKWTQVLYNGEKNQFYNPLKQNKSHIYHLSMVLNRKYRLNSVVVFVQNNADKLHCSNVVNLKDLKDYLKNFNDGTRYTVREMDEIYNTLWYERQPDGPVYFRDWFCGIKGTFTEDTLTIKEGTKGIICFVPLSGNIKKIILPKSLRKIGRQDFGDCENLEEIAAPEIEDEIKRYSFGETDGIFMQRNEKRLTFSEAHQRLSLHLEL